MKAIPYQPVPKLFLVVNVIIALIYLSWWFFPGRAGNPVLFILLLIGEIYHVAMTLMFWETVWPAKVDPKDLNFRPDGYSPPVDIFITTAGEPADIVRETARAAKEITYQNKQVYILNDGRVAQKDNWQEIERLGTELKIKVITRETPGGAKAGNINNALKASRGEIVVIFDADMAPHNDFLQKTIPFFADHRVGFVQTPQFYKNSGANYVSAGAWEQQAFFFGPILRGKEKDNAAFICGTNVAIRRKALEEIGGFVTDNIAEDFLTSIRVHQKGYISYYVPEVLAQGNAPEDFGSYLKQQFRWARGSLEAALWENVLFKPGLSLRQKLQYLSSAMFYFNGVIVFIDMVMPLIFLFTGVEPVRTATTSFAVFFVPFMFLNIYTLYLASDASLTFRAISFNQSAWMVHTRALLETVFRLKTTFVVTPKTAQKSNYTGLVFPHLAYIFLAGLGIIFAIVQRGLDPAVSTNIAWAIFNIVMFVPFIKAAYE